MKKNIIRWCMIALEKILEPLASRYFERPVFIVFHTATIEEGDMHVKTSSNKLS